MRRAIPAALIATIFFIGCSSYSTLQDPLPGPEDRRTMRVSLDAGSALMLEDAYAEGDTLYGLQLNVETHRLPCATIPLGNVEKLEERHISLIKTIGLVIIIAAPIAAMVAAQATTSPTGF